MIEATSTASNANATEELYHTNLLRLQAEQLLSESILPLCSQTGYLDKEVKWCKDVQEYIETVRNTIRKVNAVDLSPSDVKLKQNQKEAESDITVKLSEQKFWIELQSDKAKRHLESYNKSSDDNDTDQAKDDWSFHFPGGEHLQTSTINSYAAYGAGLTTATANANVTPTVDLAVLLPAKNRNDDDDADAMISGKDYMNGRYFDVRFLPSCDDTANFSMDLIFILYKIMKIMDI